MPHGPRLLAPLLLVIGLLGSQTQCGGGSGGTAMTPAPALASFAASPATITTGGSSTLTGVFTNGTGVITPGNLPVTSGKPVTVTPSATTVYTLIVTNPNGTSAHDEAGVTVVPAGAALVTPNAVQASGAQQATAGGSFSNGAVVGEPVPAKASASPSNTLQVRHDFQPPVPAPVH